MIGWLVEQEQVRVGREGPGQRGPRELAAREGVEAAVEVGVDEPEAVERCQCALAPVPAARVLQASLVARVAVEKLAVVWALGHLDLGPAQPLLQRHELGAARQHVLAQAEISLPRRALIVERHPRALLERELAAVDRCLGSQHPQQRGLAGAVAPSERHPVAALELEGHAAEQQRARHVLVEPGCDHDGHVDVDGRARRERRIDTGNTFSARCAPRRRSTARRRPEAGRGASAR